MVLKQGYLPFMFDDYFKLKNYTDWTKIDPFIRDCNLFVFFYSGKSIRESKERLGCIRELEMYLETHPHLEGSDEENNLFNDRRFIFVWSDHENKKTEIRDDLKEKYNHIVNDEDSKTFVILQRNWIQSYIYCDPLNKGWEETFITKINELNCGNVPKRLEQDYDDLLNYLKGKGAKPKPDKKDNALSNNKVKPTTDNNHIQQIKDNGDQKAINLLKMGITRCYGNDDPDNEMVVFSKDGKSGLLNRDSEFYDCTINVMGISEFNWTIYDDAFEEFKRRLDTNVDFKVSVLLMNPMCDYFKKGVINGCKDKKQAEKHLLAFRRWLEIAENFGNQVVIKLYNRQKTFKIYDINQEKMIIQGYRLESDKDGSPLPIIEIERDPNKPRTYDLFNYLFKNEFEKPESKSILDEKIVNYIKGNGEGTLEGYINSRTWKNN